MLRVEDASGLLTASVYLGEGRESLSMVTSGSNSVEFESSAILRFNAAVGDTYWVSIALNGLAFGVDTKVILEPLEIASNASEQTAMSLGSALPQTFGDNLLRAVAKSNVNTNPLERA